MNRVGFIVEKGRHLGQSVVNANLEENNKKLAIIMAMMMSQMTRAAGEDTGSAVVIIEDEEKPNTAFKIIIALCLMMFFVKATLWALKKRKEKNEPEVVATIPNKIYVTNRGEKFHLRENCRGFTHELTPCRICCSRYEQWEP